MDNISLSKSKYCKAVQCKKILWLDKNKIEERVEKARDAVLENGKKEEELAKAILGEYIDIAYNEDLSKMIEDTKYALKNIPSIIYINNQYERQGKLELEELFNIEDVTNIAISKQKEIENNLKEIGEM